jgi:hypothetical protein
MWYLTITIINIPKYKYIRFERLLEHLKKDLIMNILNKIKYNDILIIE